MADALGSEGEVVGRLQESRGLRTGGRIAGRVALVGSGFTANVATLQDFAVLTDSDMARNPNHIEEGGTQVNENDPDVSTEETIDATSEGANGGASAEGILARIWSALTGEEGQPPAMAGDPSEPEADNDREGTENMTETTDQAETLTSEADGQDLRAELEEARRENAELESRVAGLIGKNAETAQMLAEERADNELSGFQADGAPKFQVDLTRDDLIAAYLPDASVEDQARADKWRKMLTGVVGTVEYGERGAAGGENLSALDKANAKARDLMEAEPSLTLSAARSRVWESTPDLAKEYQEEVS